MRRNTLMLAALGLSAAHASLSAAESLTPQFHRIAQPTEGTTKGPLKLVAKPAPVHTQMQATLRPDGSIELRCTEHHDHPDQQRPRIGKEQ